MDPFLSAHSCLPAGLFSQRPAVNFGTGAARLLAIVAPLRLDAATWRHPTNACCLARSAAREACELRGRPGERLCHGFVPELAGDHPGLDGWDLAFGELKRASTADKTTTPVLP
jgi:hypothetical protein